MAYVSFYSPPDSCNQSARISTSNSFCGSLLFLGYIHRQPTHVQNHREYFQISYTCEIRFHGKTLQIEPMNVFDYIRTRDNNSAVL